MFGCNSCLPLKLLISSESSGPMADSDTLETSDDLISNMPDIVTDKILKRLTISVVAKTSVLSRTWRRMWLSHQYLTFDTAFWAGFCKENDWQKASKIISNILCHHHGPFHSIYIELRPENADFLVEKHESLSQWLSLLSRTSPKKISLINWAAEWSNLVVMPSYIFHCTELTKLKLQCFVLNPLPYDFKGFPHLRSLELVWLKFSQSIDMLWSIIAKCPCLVFLSIQNCLGMDFLEIDAPSIEKLIIKGQFDSLIIKKSPRLIDISLSSTKPKMDSTKTVVDTVKSLASSYELQSLAIGGDLCEFLAAGGINKSLPLAFNHLNVLRLTELMSSDPDVFCFTLGMLQSCPLISDLEISFKSTSVADDAVEQKYEYCSDHHKLERLHQAKFTDIIGASAELKLIEHVLAISVVLEKMFFKCKTLDTVSELKVSRQLMRFPRASKKAQLVCLECEERKI